MAEAQILIVEDETIIARDIETRLKGLGYAVPAIVSSGEDAVVQAAETRPDLVLMDVQLTGETDGVTAAEEIQARFDIPVVYLTACADDETLERAKISGPFDYILKPVEATELISAVEMALYKHRLEKRLRESETLLTAIGDQISVAIGNARLYQEARQRTGELAALNRAGQVITSSLDLDIVLPQVIAEARAMLNVTNWSLPPLPVLPPRSWWVRACQPQPASPGGLCRTDGQYWPVIHGPIHVFTATSTTSPT
jgi:CheY-like chemotaxis protein